MQEFLRKYFPSLVDNVTLLLAKISWKQKHALDEERKEELANMLKNDYYIILTRRGNYLSTYMIGIMGFILYGKFGFYSHSLMNLEDEAKDPSDFRLVEATGAGVAYSTFNEVFQHPDAVCLLKPKNISLEEWTLCLDASKKYLGRPYDTLFDLSNDASMSCVELVRSAMKTLPDYDTKFGNFEKIINKTKNLTPQMFKDCEDFEVVYEIMNK